MLEKASQMITFRSFCVAFLLTEKAKTLNLRISSMVLMRVMMNTRYMNKTVMTVRPYCDGRNSSSRKHPRTIDYGAFRYFVSDILCRCSIVQYLIIIPLLVGHMLQVRSLGAFVFFFLALLSFYGE